MQIRVQARTGYQDQAFQVHPSHHNPSLPEWMQRIYQTRGVHTTAQLDYRLSRLLPFQQLKQMTEAVALIARDMDQAILILGDFDADGATSTTRIKISKN